MPPVRAPDGGDLGGMARCRQPVMDSGPDLSSLDRRIAGPMVPGDQQDDAVAAGYGAVEAAVDGRPSRVEVHPMKVEHPVRLDGPAT